MKRAVANAVLILCLLVTWPARSQEFSGLARVLGEQSALRDDGRGGAVLELSLSQPVPFRLFTLVDPERLVVDFREVDWSGLPEGALQGAAAVGAVHTGLYGSDWSRMVIELTRPLRVESAGLRVEPGQGARLIIRLSPVAPEDFRAAAGAPPGALFAQGERLPSIAPLAPRRDDGPLVVVLDPGHGGIDPGAEAGGIDESDLMLGFARELAEVLLRTSGMQVVLTRDDDIFVPLETRLSIAHQAGADVFLSLHADALVEGRAAGATVYTLSDKASDAASQKLAERHDRADLLTGVDLSQQDDVVARVLMDVARTETRPRTEKLAQALVNGLSGRIEMHKRPWLEAGFSVLKAPDIPSVLLELGFLSSERDRKLLGDADWRRRAAEGIRDALVAWAAEDAADAGLRMR